MLIVKDVYCPAEDCWSRLKTAYKMAVKAFPYYEVGIKKMKEDIRLSMVYIKGKDVRMEEITQVDVFVEIVKDAYKIYIFAAEEGNTEIDIIFT